MKKIILALLLALAMPAYAAPPTIIQTVLSTTNITGNVRITGNSIAATNASGTVILVGAGGLVLSNATTHVADGNLFLGTVTVSNKVVNFVSSTGNNITNKFGGLGVHTLEIQGTNSGNYSAMTSWKNGAGTIKFQIAGFSVDEGGAILGAGDLANSTLGTLQIASGVMKWQTPASGHGFRSATDAGFVLINGAPLYGTGGGALYGAMTNGILVVTGALKSAGINYPTAIGTSNWVVTSDGVGTLYLAAAAAGGGGGDVFTTSNNTFTAGTQKYSSIVTNISSFLVGTNVNYNNGTGGAFDIDSTSNAVMTVVTKAQHVGKGLALWGGDQANWQVPLMMGYTNSYSRFLLGNEANVGSLLFQFPNGGTYSVADSGRNVVQLWTSSAINLNQPTTMAAAKVFKASNAGININLSGAITNAPSAAATITFATIAGLGTFATNIACTGATPGSYVIEGQTVTDDAIIFKTVCTNLNFIHMSWYNTTAAPLAPPTGTYGGTAIVK